MEGQQEEPPSSLVPFYWTPGWNSVQAMYKYLDEPDAALRGGDPGIRLIEPSGSGKKVYFKHDNTNLQELEKNEWLIVPVTRIFGSDELSSVGSSMLQKTPQPFVLMNQNDADMISIKGGELIQLEILKTRLIIRVRIENSLKAGVAGLSVNLPGMPFVDIPGTAKFHKL
jgi:NADH-quinone oxidoreductase subunit G